MKLTIIRGLPGSGKSTLAHSMENDLTVAVEADHFHMRFNDTDVQEYQYRPELGKLSHQWCQSFTAFLLNKDLNVVVANTFTTQAEVDPYLDICRLFDITPEIIVCREDYGSVHNVPADVIEKMKDRWQEDLVI